MPRNGSDIYYIPPGTEGFPDTTIESAKYNTYIHDVETDLNRPRPISAGGTGANNADDALINLDGEKASQYVANYDTHVWYNGSFRSGAETTGTPVAGHSFAGWVYTWDTPASPPLNKNVVVQARDLNDIAEPGRVYVRQKSDGVWGPWSLDGTGIFGPDPPVNPPDGTLWWDSESGHLYVWYRDVDSAQWVIASPFPDPAQFLLKAGDTMTGTLGLAHAPVNPMDAVNKQYLETVSNIVQGQVNNKVERSGDTMSGSLTVNSTLQSNGNIIAGYNQSWGTYYFSSSLKYLTFDGAYFIFNGADLHVNANVMAGSFITIRTGLPEQGVIYFGDSYNKYIQFDGSQFNLTGAGAVIGGALGAQGNVTIGNAPGSFMPPHGEDGGYQCKAGDGNVRTSDYFNIQWTGAASFHVNRTYMGNFTLTSDYRVKKDVRPLPSTWETIKSLKPIKYTHKDFTPPSEKDHDGPFIKGDEIERWGLTAHELQETLIASAATGAKDQDNAIQAINPMTIIAALTKALQEAMGRIEALEART